MEYGIWNMECTYLFCCSFKSDYIESKRKLVMLRVAQIYSLFGKRNSNQLIKLCKKKYIKKTATNNMLFMSLKSKDVLSMLYDYLKKSNILHKLPLFR
jgi:hypothetical protein